MSVTARTPSRRLTGRCALKVTISAVVHHERNDANGQTIAQRATQNGAGLLPTAPESPKALFNLREEDRNQRPATRAGSAAGISAIADQAVAAIEMN